MDLADINKKYQTKKLKTKPFNKYMHIYKLLSTINLFIILVQIKSIILYIYKSILLLFYLVRGKLDSLKLKLPTVYDS